MPTRLGGGFAEAHKFFYFNKRATSIAGFGRFCHDIAFLPFRANSPFHFFRERARLWMALRIDRLSVDFTALSIAAHSCMSSPEQTRLLITMGLMLAKIRDWKLGRWNFGRSGSLRRGSGWAESGVGDTVVR